MYVYIGTHVNTHIYKYFYNHPGTLLDTLGTFEQSIQQIHALTVSYTACSKLIGAR